MSLLIKNGLIIDGTGSEAYKSDILIDGGIIQKIGNDFRTENCEIIDASNRVVCPGFIDMHSHGDFTIMHVNKAEATIMQGITTLVVAMCGIGVAPANDKVRRYYDEFVTKIFVSGKMKLYDSLNEYMEAIEKKGTATNLAFFIPQGNVRVSVLGTEDRKATEQEIDEMKRIVQKNMDAGAFGLSTGLVYPPGSMTPTEEIIELCKVVKNYNGIYDSHMRNEGTGVIKEGMSELIRVAKEAKIQAQISHWKAGSSFAWNLTPEMIKTVERAREQGIEIYADIYPYEEGSTSLSAILLRPWVYENFKENLSNKDTREKIVREVLELFFSTYISDLPKITKILPKFLMKKMIFSSVKKLVRIISVVHNHQVEGLRLGEALEKLYPKRKFTDAVLDFIRDEEGGIMITYKQMSEEKSILELIKQDFVCIGSDGFLVMDNNTHPRSYGCFPKILGEYVREKKIFSLEEAIRKMTGLTASILGLKDRGLIKRNYKADLVIFDPDTVKDTSTYSNGRQFPIGIDYVIVNGEITVKNGHHLGVLKGQILKHN